MRIKVRSLAVVVAIVSIFLTTCASSDSERASLPPDAVITAEEQMGDMLLLRLTAETGETMVLLRDGAGMPVFLATEKPAAVDQTSPQTVDEAKAAVLAVFPDALIIKVESVGELKAVYVVTPCFLGTLWTAGGRVYSRNLTGGSFIADGRLTLDGAYHAAQFIQPEVEFVAIEYDKKEDIYEGDALIDGVKYELELDARTGQLLEWERD